MVYSASRILARDIPFNETTQFGFSEEVASTSPTWFSTNTIAILVLFVLVQKLATAGWKRWANACGNGPLLADDFEEIVANSVWVFWSIVLLFMQFVASTSVARSERAGCELVRLAAYTLCLLYIWESLFYSRSRYLDLVHAAVVIAFIIVAVAILERTAQPSIYITLLALMYGLTLDQGVFLGHILYYLRASPPLVCKVMIIAGVQSLVAKIASAIFILAWWRLRQWPINDVSSASWNAWKIWLPVILLVWFSIEMYRCAIMISFAIKLRSSPIDHSTDVEKLPPQIVVDAGTTQPTPSASSSTGSFPLRGRFVPRSPSIIRSPSPSNISSPASSPVPSPIHTFCDYEQSSTRRDQMSPGKDVRVHITLDSSIPKVMRFLEDVRRQTPSDSGWKSDSECWRSQPTSPISA